MWLSLHVHLMSLSGQKILSSPLKMKEQGFIEIIGISKVLQLGWGTNVGFKLSLSLRFSLLDRSSGNNSLGGKCFSESEEDLGYWRKI